MGFGLLLGSYFLSFAFSISPTYLFTDVLGALWMLYAFYKLSQYNRYFWSALLASGAFLLASAVGAVLILTGNYVSGSFTDILIDCVKTAFSAGIHIFMYLGIRGIASGADCPKIIKQSKRNMHMMGGYYFLYYAVLVTGSLYAQYVTYVSVFVYLYWLICFILNLVMLYTCFGMLYDEEIEHTERKQSRIPFLNKMHEKFDSLDDGINKYRRDSMEMAMEEAEKIHQKKKKKKKKK